MFCQSLIGEDFSGKRVYRLAQIMSFKEKSSYLVEGFKTTKYLVLKSGNSTKSFSIAVISNASPSQFDYEKWCRETPREVPIESEAKRISRHLQEVCENYVYTEEEVAKILEKKPVKVNLVEEKIRLTKLLDVAKQENRETNGLEQDLARVEQKLNEKKMVTKKKNVSNDQGGEDEEEANYTSEEEELVVKKGSTTLDPFARRPTRSQGLYVTTVIQASPNKLKEGLIDAQASPLDSPGRALHKAHDFEIDLKSMTAPIPPPLPMMQSMDFVVPTKKISFLDYKRKKNL